MDFVIVVNWAIGHGNELLLVNIDKQDDVVWFILMHNIFVVISLFVLGFISSWIMQN